YRCWKRSRAATWSTRRTRPPRPRATSGTSSATSTSSSSDGGVHATDESDVLPALLRLIPRSVLEALHVELNRQQVANVEGVHGDRSLHEILGELGDLHPIVLVAPTPRPLEQLVDFIARVAQHPEVVIAGRLHVLVGLREQDEVLRTVVAGEQEVALLEQHDVETRPAEHLAVERGDVSTRRLVEPAARERQLHVVEPVRHRTLLARVQRYLGSESSGE